MTKNNSRTPNPGREGSVAGPSSHAPFGPLLRGAPAPSPTTSPDPDPAPEQAQRVIA